MRIWIHTAMKIAMLHPLALGSWYISARIPGAIATIELPKMPESSRKTRNEFQLGAMAQDIVNRVKRMKLAMVMYRRPYSSLSGAHTIGPAIVIHQLELSIHSAILKRTEDIA